MINKIERSEIPGRACSYNNMVTAEVLQFHKSDWDACEVNIGKYKNAKSACAAYKAAIKKANVGVVPVMRGDRLFLIRK